MPSWYSPVDLHGVRGTAHSILVLLLAAACGGSRHAGAPVDAGAGSADDGAGYLERLDAQSAGVGFSDAPLDLQQACSHLSAPYCSAFHLCAPEWFATQYVEEAACVGNVARDCVERRTAPGNMATAADLEGCASATGAIDCLTFFGNLERPRPPIAPACAFKGTLADGSYCIDDGQCQSAKCAFYLTDACGTCVTPDESLPCTLDKECPSGRVCSPLQQCVPPAELGSPCGSDDRCGSSLVCRKGTCETRAKEGEACDAMLDDCVVPLYCNAVSHVCERELVHGASGPCYVLATGQFAACAAGFTCTSVRSGDICGAPYRLGQSCGFSSDCDTGLSCLEGTCTRLSASVCSSPSLTDNPQYPALMASLPQLTKPPSAKLLTTPKIVAVTFAGDPYADAIEAFLRELGPSDYWSQTTKEYGVAPLVALAPIRLTENASAAVSEAEIETWLTSHLGTDPAWPANDGSTIYALFYPLATTITERNGDVSCRDFRGYHNAVADTSGALAPYAVVPRCTVLGPPTSTTSHEVVEIVTDPFPRPIPSGYYDVDSDHSAWWAIVMNSETGDICSWQPLARYVDPQLGQQVQRTWSNARMLAFHHPCAPAFDQAPYFNAVPEWPDTVTIMAGAMSRTTKGVTIPLGQTKSVTLDLLSDGHVEGGWRVSAYDLDAWRGSRRRLHFQFDKQFGNNGDKIQLAITALTQDPTFKAEPFLIVSRRGRQTNLWPGIVGN